MILELSLALAASTRQDAPTPALPPEVPIEVEVLGNVKAQPIGPATVDDLALPDEFLKRVSDRIVRSSFESRYRIVVPDAPPPGASPVKAAPAKAPERALLYAIIGGGLALVLAIVALRRKPRRTQ